MRVLILALAFGSTACASGSGIVPRGVATAELMDAAQTKHGNVTIRPEGARLRVVADVTNTPAGSYGIHLHTIGQCLGLDFATAGPHWNPSARQHGRDNPEGAHHGDLPNVVVGSDGKGRLDATVPGTLAELIDADGASIVLHAKADDYRTDPSGNSGGRVACGVLLAVPK